MSTNPEMEVPVRDRSKPDPDEPFRHVCPGCGNQVHRSNGGYIYHCSSCNESYEFEELHDLKEDDRRWL